MKKTTLIALAAIVLASCSTSNEVVNNNRIQKRKYTKGWHVKKSTKFWKTKGTHEEELVAKTETTPNTEEQVEIKLQVKQQALRSNDLKSLEVENTVQNTVAETAIEKSTPALAVNDEQKEEKSKASLKEKLVAKAVVNKIEKALAQEDLPGELTALAESQNKEEASSWTDDTDLILLYVLAVLIPFVAVGIVTNWDIGQVLLNVLLCCLCGIPGIIHAIIVVKNNA